MSKRIKSRAESFPDWYQDVCQAAELAENSPVRGCMVIRPHGYALWENIKGPLDRMFKESGHENAYFPIFIPKSFIEKEAQHVEGFAPELAVVTHGGGKELDEPLVIRPTSETMVGHMYSKWIQSHRDLPVLINQWANVVRWEMRTRLFLRTTEFLWQEGHTAHATEAEAQEETLRMLDIYERLCVEYLAVPVRKGIKSDAERFAGARSTYAVEALMQDGKALQMATSHNLGQNFAKAFDIQFQDVDGERKFAWTTSWGMSTRTVGGVVMVHGDDDGLVLPPKIAPIQAVIVPIFRKDDEKSKVLAEAAKVKAALVDAGLKVRLDDREQLKPGPKFFEWEKKGVPVRLELGPRDVDQKQTVLVRRDNKSKEPVALDAVADTVTKLMDTIQSGLYERAKARMDDHTRRADTMKELEALLDEPGGFVSAHWDGTGKTEEAIKELTKATIRVMPFDDEPETGKCILTGEPSARRVLFARAY